MLSKSKLLVRTNRTFFFVEIFLVESSVAYFEMGITFLCVEKVKKKPKDKSQRECVCVLVEF